MKLEFWAVWAFRPVFIIVWSVIGAAVAYGAFLIWWPLALVVGYFAAIVLAGGLARLNRLLLALRQPKTVSAPSRTEP